MLQVGGQQGPDIATVSEFDARTWMWTNSMLPPVRLAKPGSERRSRDIISATWSQRWSFGSLSTLHLASRPSRFKLRNEG